MSLKFKVTRDKNGIFRPLRRPVCGLRLVKHLKLLVLSFFIFSARVRTAEVTVSSDSRCVSSSQSQPAGGGLPVACGRFNVQFVAVLFQLISHKYKSRSHIELHHYNANAESLPSGVVTPYSCCDNGIKRRRN